MAKAVSSVLPTLLSSADLSHLAPFLEGQTLATLQAHEPRTSLLAFLKECGISKLADRQKLASAVARAKREAAAQARPAEPEAAGPPPPEGCAWRSWCSGSTSWEACGGPPSRLPRAAPIPSSVPEESEDPAAEPQPTDAESERRRHASLLVLDGVLGPSECQALVARAEAAGFGGRASRHQNSSARKETLSDGGLAAELFARIQHALPRTAGSSGGTALWGPPVGLWEAFRVHSYDDGDVYKPHRDNCCKVGGSAYFPACCSFLSVLCYLNDSTDGCGATRFHLQDECRDVVPRAGRVVVFDHGLVHESLVAGACRKYIARSDVRWCHPNSRPPASAGRECVALRVRLPRARLAGLCVTRSARRVASRVPASSQVLFAPPAFSCAAAPAGGAAGDS